MKRMKAICTATILALALSIPAFAGEISTPGVASPGEIGTPGASVAGEIGSAGVLGEISTPGLLNILWAVALTL